MMRFTWIPAAAAACLIGSVVAACSGSTRTFAGPTSTVLATVTQAVTQIKTAEVYETIRITEQPTRVVATKTHTLTVTYTPPPPKQFGAGTYKVGTDIKAGKYKSAGAQDCYWARLDNLDGSSSAVVANHFGPGQQYLTIEPGDAGFQVSGDCTFGRA